ncbi:MAG TPA: hypothetical protein PLI57_04410 [Spirochaetota bacterium]|nr:hypothetical protein [Spirochaetota bacterium]
MLRKLLSIFAITLVCGASINSLEDLTLDTFFTAEEIRQTLDGNILSKMYVKFNAKKENTVEFIEIPRTLYNDEDFSVYEVVTDEKFFLPYDLETRPGLDLYNKLLSYSGLEGMVYYSRRAGKSEKLIKKSHRVRSISEKREEDVAYSEIKPQVTNLFLQKDNKLGTLYFRNELFSVNSDFVMINTCVVPISKAIFTLNDKNEYKIYSFFLYDAEKRGFFVYTFQAMRVKQDGLLKSGLIAPTTFFNRLRASTVHLAKMLNMDWTDKLNPWPGLYDTY